MTLTRLQQIKNIIECPYCHSEIEWLKDYVLCEKCSCNFPIESAVPIFYKPDVKNTAESRFQSEQMFDNTFTAKIYNKGRKLISSEFMPKNHILEFLKRTNSGDIIIEIGSGNRRLRGDVINLDIFLFPNVDIVADGAKTPFKNNIVDFVVLDTVLEHVPEPHKIIKEIFRILKPGGECICIVPFIFPYHGYPAHYFNFSKDGLDFLFKDFSDCKVELNMGPTSAMVNLFSEYFAVAISGENKFIYTLCKGAILIPTFFLKYLDVFWKPTGRGINIASHLCAVAKK